MKRQVSSKYTQLTINFEVEATPAPTFESPKSTSLPADYFQCTKSDFEEQMALEHDIMYGRGAYLYAQIEKDLAFQRKQAQMLDQFEAMRASIYR